MRLLFVLSVITYLDRICINSAAPEMAADLGFSETEKGWIFGLFFLAYGLFEIPTGRWGDKIGPRKVLTRIVVWWSMFTALTGLGRSVAQLATIRFLFGMGEAGAYPNSSVTISRWFPADERGRAHGMVWTASRLGGALSPFIVIPLIAWFGWRGAFLALSPLGLVWAVVWFRWFKDDPREKDGVNQAEVDLIGPPAKRYGKVPWGVLFSSPNMWAIIGMYHLFCFASNWYLSWLTSYLKSSVGFEGMMLILFSSLPFVLGALANYVGGWTSDRLSKAWGLKRGRRTVGMAGVGAAGLLMLLSVTIETPWIAAIVIALSFGCSDFMLPNSWAVCLDVGRENAGAITGAMNTAGQIAGFLMSIGFGWITDNWGASIGVAILGCCSLASAAMWLLIDPTKPVDTRRDEEDREEPLEMAA